MSSSRRYFLTCLCLVTLSSMVISDVALAGRMPASRGSARSTVNRGGGARSGGGNRTNVSSHNTNINSNRNVNVNVNHDVDVHGGYGGGSYYGGGCCYHPVATAAAVTAATVVTAAVVGSIVNTLPPSCAAVAVNGLTYQQCGSTWYQPQYAGSNVTYVVVNAPR
jgi:hypothetical protein